MVSKYPGVRYYSASKKQEFEIEEMNDSHLLNAWRKAMASTERDPAVFAALDAEVKERGLDKPKPAQGEEVRL